MSDKTQEQFYNKEVDEVMALGQEMLWEAAEDFNKRMHRAVVDGQPIPIGDMGMIMASIKIIKAAEAMVYIQKNGPIYEDGNGQHTDEDEVVPKSLPGDK